MPAVEKGLADRVIFWHRETNSVPCLCFFKPITFVLSSAKPRMQQQCPYKIMLQISNGKENASSRLIPTAYFLWATLQVSKSKKGVSLYHVYHYFIWMHLVEQKKLSIYYIYWSIRKWETSIYSLLYICWHCTRGQLHHRNKVVSNQSYSLFHLAEDSPLPEIGTARLDEFAKYNVPFLNGFKSH